MLVPLPGIQPTLPPLESGILTTGPPGMFLIPFLSATIVPPTYWTQNRWWTNIYWVVWVEQLGADLWDLEWLISSGYLNGSNEVQIMFIAARRQGCYPSWSIPGKLWRPPVVDAMVYVPGPPSGMKGQALHKLLEVLPADSSQLKGTALSKTQGWPASNDWSLRQGI